MTAPRLTCATCGDEVIPVQGVTAYYEHGVWWHARCAAIVLVKGEPGLAEFPSQGKLIPKTILTRDQPDDDAVAG